MASPDPPAIRDALERVLRSPSFVNAGRLSRMLRFVVERTLEGQGDGLKEYLLGVEVFDRPTEFDPRLDSIVRVEARRLRAKLAEYYDGEGAADAIRFRLAKGGYVPTFERAEGRGGDGGVGGTEVPPYGALHVRVRRRWALGLVILALGSAGAVLAVRAWPPAVTSAPAPVATVAVLPFQVFTGREDDQRLADRLTDGVTTELARDGRLGVAAATGARQFRGAARPVGEVAAALGVRYVMEAVAHVDGPSIRVEARLVDGAVGRKMWVEDFTGGVEDLDGLERRIASAASRLLLERSGSP
jgi:serine/threonine-protein kinase